MSQFIREFYRMLPTFEYFNSKLGNYSSFKKYLIKVYLQSFVRKFVESCAFTRPNDPRVKLGEHPRAEYVLQAYEGNPMEISSWDLTVGNKRQALLTYDI